MRYVWILLVLIASAINLMPVTGAFAPERMSALYGVNLDDPNLEILMRHRALLFGIVGGLLVAAVLRPSLRTLAYVVGFASMVSFLIVAWGVGGYSTSIEQVMLMDGIGIAALAGAGLVDALGPRGDRA